MYTRMNEEVVTMSQHEQCMLDPSVIQMKQQLLHFRSEMVRQDRLLKQVEKNYMKEKGP